MRILETTGEIRTRINKILSKQVADFLRKKQDTLRMKVSRVVGMALQSSPEIQSLRGGTLKYDFGLTEDPSEAIISAVMDSVRVQINPLNFSKGRFTAGITVFVQPSTFSNLLSLSVANQEIDDGSLPWLSWLLTEGDNVIITNFNVIYTSGGRSGGGIMAPGGAFKVSPNYSGTLDNNFITRAIDSHIGEITRVIQKEIS